MATSRGTSEGMKDLDSLTFGGNLRCEMHRSSACPRRNRSCPHCGLPIAGLLGAFLLLFFCVHFHILVLPPHQTPARESLSQSLGAGPQQGQG